MNAAAAARDPTGALHLFALAFDLTWGGTQVYTLYLPTLPDFSGLPHYSVIKKASDKLGKLNGPLGKRVPVDPSLAWI